MTAQLAPAPIFRSWDNNGNPLVGGQLFTYQAGTMIPQATYVDSTQTTQNTNPVILNFRGEAVVWLNPNLNYKFVLEDTLGNTIWTEDNIPGSQLNVPIGTSLIPTPTNTQTLGNASFSWANVYVGPNQAPILDTTTGILGYYPRSAVEIAASITPTSFSYPDGNVLRYGADPTGTADSTYAFQQACLSTYAGWVPTSSTFQPRVVTVPGGRYKFAGVNTPYGTPTVYVRSGITLNCGGQGTTLDLTAWGAVSANVFQLGWGFISGTATQDPGGYPVEFCNAFLLGGPSGGGAAVAMWFNGGFVHDCWFSAAGTAINLRGGYIYDCEIDIGLTGMTVSGGTDQTVDNVRFFNQNTAINFDNSVGDFSDIIFTGCVIEFPKVIGVNFGAGGHLVKGVKFVGCDFVNNPASTVTGFSTLVSIATPSLQAEFDACTFHNWGTFAQLAPAYAFFINATGAIIDVKGCIFDGAVTNAAFTASTNASVADLVTGTLRMTDCQIRNLPATYGQGILLSGSSANILQVDGLLYSGSAQTALTLTAVTVAAAAVVTSSSASASNPFQVGAYLTFTVAGMTQLNGAQGIITAVGGTSGAWTATLNLATTGFAAFTSGTCVQSLPLVSLTNSNSSSQCYLANIKGDAIQPLFTPQSNFAVRLKNATDWFGALANWPNTNVNYVLVPFGPGNLWQVALGVNENQAGSGAYRKCRLDNIEKDNDFAASAKSFLVQATAVQGAANTNGLITLTAEFNQPGGTATVASVNSGVMSLSWPNSYASAFTSIDVQQLLAA